MVAVLIYLTVTSRELAAERGNRDQEGALTLGTQRLYEYRPSHMYLRPLIE